MSKPVFDDLFQFSGRRNRQSYLLVQLATWLATAVGIFVGVFGLATLDNPGALATLIGAVLVISGFVLALGAIVAAWITSAQRVRDIGYSGVWCLIQLVPYIGFVAGLIILLMPGETEIDNRYGPSQIKPQLATA